MAGWGGVSAAEIGMAVRLFLCGFLILFLELTLIRFLAGNIWNLGYFPNLVLLAAFIGLGAGFLAHERFGRERMWFAAAPLMTLLLVVGVYFLRPGIPGFDNEQAAGQFDTELFWTVHLGEREENPLWFLFALWFLTTAAIFAAIAQYTAKVFQRFSPLTAYSLDIGGSLAGVGAFIAVSFLQVQAEWWFVFCAALWAGAFFCGAGKSLRPMILAGGAACFLATAGLVHHRDSFDPILKGESRWSPYQKLTHVEGGKIYANNIDHQNIEGEEVIRSAFYSQIYDIREEAELPPIKRALIIGAGSGNDVAAALLHDVDFVHAVEIDPLIYELGVRHHPLKPYSDPRVSITIDDGRHAMFVSDEKYDLIIFALTDSLVKASAVSQLRLENYLFTEEAMQRAWSRLNDNGTLLLYNFYRRDWLVHKLLAMMANASGAKPAWIRDRAFSVIYAHNDGATKDFTLDAAEVEIPTDDWPFLYLKERGLPSHYVAATLMMLALAAAIFFAFRPQGKNTGGRLRLRLAFMTTGAAFLLLEAKSVIQFSLLFGTTWLAAAIVFFGALSLVLAANWTARLIPSPRLAPAAFVLLGLSCLFVIVYPPSNLVHWQSAFLRAAGASVLVFTPIFFANLVFASLFRECKQEAEKYFGWNLLGGSLGGGAEYASMALGYHALAWAVLACYAAVFICLLPEILRSIKNDSSFLSDSVFVPERQRGFRKSRQ